MLPFVPNLNAEQSLSFDDTSYVQITVRMTVQGVHMMSPRSPAGQKGPQNGGLPSKRKPSRSPVKIAGELPLHLASSFQWTFTLQGWLVHVHAHETQIGPVRSAAQRVPHLLSMLNGCAGLSPSLASPRRSTMRRRL